jgi:predicted TPR repeat methyltransferase
MDGIDISEKMLLKAGKKGLYRNLLNGEITTLLAHSLSEIYDLIVAADVFAYFGELNTVFSLTADSVASGGLFFFSVETMNDANRSAFALQESGRFSHSDTYIRKTAENNGWIFLNSRELNLRKERDRWIQGMIYGFRRK